MLTRSATCNACRCVSGAALACMACQVAPRSAALRGAVCGWKARVTQIRWYATTLNLLSSSVCVADRWHTHRPSS